MAKVSLRIYNREISTLIDQGQFDESISHCHHILKTFPKYLETYRLLGKAYLEAKRFNDAGDIFSRVLTSVPNDFVSHVGMSMIADEKNKADEAIWHMQRAFESQPSNAAVQGELQRLYGRRDGVEPTKIRMTSGALAHVYVQGELYAQAIAEIRSVESKDPGRADMQVLLANAYFRSGQRVEASQIASDILKKFPYCLDANRILIEILPETSRAEGIQIYTQRVNALDPYTAFIKGSVFNVDEVSDMAISLERLDWHPGEALQLSGGWGNSSGIESSGDEEPDWLKQNRNARDPELASSMEKSSAEEEIPDFMRAAGWGSSDGEAEPTSFFDSSNPDPEGSATEDAVALSQAEMPDWMKTMAPVSEELKIEDESEIGDNMASDEWINDLLDDNESESKDKKPLESPQNDAGVEDDLIGSLGTSADDQDAAMNWLESLAVNQGAKAEELITDPSARTESAPEWVEQAKDVSEGAPLADKTRATEEDDALAWLNEEKPQQEEPATETADEDIPDWLRVTKEESTVAETADKDMPDWMKAVEEEETPLAEISESDMPDWMQEMKEESTAPEVEAPASAEKEAVETETLISDSAIGELGASADDQDAAMNWLESLAVNQGAKAEELITDPNARTESAPEWVEQAKEVSAETPAVETDDELAWLNETDADEKPIDEISEGDMPDWMQEIKDESTAPKIEEAVPAEKEAVESETLITDSAIGELGASADDQDAAMNWLESLAVNQGAKAEELITDPNARTESAPEWVEQAKEISAETPAIEADDELAWINDASKEEVVEETPVVEADSELAWINEAIEEEPVAKETDDIPEWLQDAKDEPTMPESVESTATERDDELAWINDAAVEEPVATEVDDTPEWLREKAEESILTAPPAPQTGESETPQTEAKAPAELTQEEEKADDDAPTWIKAMDESSSEPLPPAVEAIPPAETEEDLPTWLDDLAGDASKEEEKPADEPLPDWMKENDVAEKRQPTQASEWRPIENLSENKPAPEGKAETASDVAEEVVSEKATAPKIPDAQAKTEKRKSKRRKRMDTTMLRDIKLMGAQAAMDEGNISAALDEYGKLIKKNRLLDEVIYALREALDDYPIDISIMQTLGDAYMRAGRLQEAIDAYTNAEELLR